MTGRVGYVLPPFPVRSETFVAGEVRRLVARSVPIVPIVLAPESGADETQLAALREAGIEPYYLGAGNSGRTLALAASYAARHPARARRAWRRNAEEPSLAEVSRPARWLKVLAVAALASRWGLTHLHGHWTLPTDVALLASELTGAGFSFSTHAHDIFEDGPEYERQRPGRGLGGRIARAKFVPTCTEEGWNHLRGLVEDGLGDRVKLVYHGVDLALFDHREPSVGDPPLIVSVGRLVAYKGFDDVVAACGELHRRGVDFRCVIVGDGSQRPVLERMIAEQGLQDRVELAGSRPQAFVRDLLSRADVFVLCGKAEQGQYGLPNVLLEAAAMATPTVSRRLPSSYELVEHGGNGLLADTQEEVVDALEALLRDPERRRRLGAAARRTVEEKFDAEQTIELLADDLRAAAR